MTDQHQPWSNPNASDPGRSTEPFEPAMQDRHTATDTEQEVVDPSHDPEAAAAAAAALAAIDLDVLSREQLQAHHDRVAATLDGYAERKRLAVLEVLRSQARKLGYRLEDVLTPARAKAKRPAKPRSKAAKVARYRHPDQPELVWQGRGPKPAWLRRELKAGAELQDFAVAATSGPRASE